MYPLKAPISLKHCPKCGKEKPITQEFWYRAKKTGLIRPFCKLCDQMYRTPGMIINAKDDPRADLIKHAKKRAKLKGIEFDISREDITIPAICPILKTPICRTMKVATDSSPSIDRIDSAKGYIKGNVQIISLRANTLKNNATIEELEAVLGFLKNSGKSL